MSSLTTPRLTAMAESAGDFPSYSDSSFKSIPSLSSITLPTAFRDGNEEEKEKKPTTTTFSGNRRFLSAFKPDATNSASSTAAAAVAEAAENVVDGPRRASHVSYTSGQSSQNVDHKIMIRQKTKKRMKTKMEKKGILSLLHVVVIVVVVNVIILVTKKRPLRRRRPPRQNKRQPRQ